MITLAMIAALEMPPKFYDYVPEKSVPIMEMSPKFIAGVCHASNDSKLVLGCYSYERNKIYIRSDLTDKAKDKVLRHEYGHVNGWTHK